MRWVPADPGGGTPALGAVFGGVLVLTAGLGAIWLRLGLPRPICRFREWTGVPCPTCGTTRMAEALLAGDIAAAAQINPLVFFGLAAVAAWALASILRVALGLPAWRVALRPHERLFLRLAAVATLIVGWGYVVWRGT